MNDNVVTYEPRGVHADFLKCRDTEVAAVGRAGSGKTLAACWGIHLAAMLVPGLRGLMLRATHTALVSTTLVTFQRQVAASALADGSVQWFGGSAREPAAFRYSNGSTILVAGGDRPEKFLSAELDRIFCDEAVEIDLNLYETLISRLRGNAPTRKQIVLTTNPSHPSHWIKRRADEGRIKMFTSTHRDNPHYVNRDGSYTEHGAEYMKKLDALTGVRRLRLRDGLWTASEGVIYDEFDESIHVIDPFEIPSDWPLLLAVDFGYVNPFVCQWWRIDPDDRMYLVREIYMTGRLVEDHARQILAVMKDHPDEPEEPTVVCDHDAEGRATLKKYLGYSPRRANKAVIDGIQNLQQRFRVQGDGKPRIFFFRNAVVERDRTLIDAGKPSSTVEEIPAYVWDSTGTKGPKDMPLKLNDHGADCARYAAARLDRVRA